MFHAKRLTPGTDLKAELEDLVGRENLEAAGILSLVGSLSCACLRLAGANETTELPGPFEIVGATGTLGPEGIHVHLVIADNSGATYGGHLTAGCVILTTAEVVLVDLSSEWRFERALDSNTGHKELIAQRKIIE